MRQVLIEQLVKRIKQTLVTERKTDEISLKLSRMVINQFKKNENFELYNLSFERGDEYAVFDFKCYFLEDEEMDDPFSIQAEADMEEIFIEITFNPNAFPENMNDLVAEVKETIDHELEHVEQQNFQDKETYNDEEYSHKDEDFNFKYLTSKIEIPAYVRGLITRSKTKRISLEDAMDEWFEENKRKFKDHKKEWALIKQTWLDYANQMRSKGNIKKFK